MIVWKYIDDNEEVGCINDIPIFTVVFREKNWRLLRGVIVIHIGDKQECKRVANKKI